MIFSDQSDSCGAYSQPQCLVPRTTTCGGNVKQIRSRLLPALALLSLLTSGCSWFQTAEPTKPGRYQFRENLSQSEFRTPSDKWRTLEREHNPSK